MYHSHVSGHPHHCIEQSCSCPGYAEAAKSSAIINMPDMVMATSSKAIVNISSDMDEHTMTVAVTNIPEWMHRDMQEAFYKFLVRYSLDTNGGPPLSNEEIERATEKLRSLQ
jgi:uncharacterized protein (DUF1786 family)